MNPHSPVGDHLGVAVKLALSLGALTARSRPAELLAYAVEAERLGYDSVWVSEKWGSDPVSLLSWVAARTSTIGVGTAVMQTPARSPAATAMTAATVDLLSGGRFRLGLGPSTAQLAEGWHGVPFGRPLTDLREYVELVRQVLSRRPVHHAGQRYRMPLDPSLSRPMMLDLRHFRPDIPVYLGAVGPRSTQLAGEIADGWLGLFYAPGSDIDQLSDLRAGRAKAGRDLSGFDVVAMVPAVLGADVNACIDRVRGHYASFIGGMGSYYADLVTRMGYVEAAAEVRRLFLAGDPKAAAAVPGDLIDRTALLGPVSRIAQRLDRYAESGITTLSVLLFPTDAEDGLRTLDAVLQAASGIR